MNEEKAKKMFKKYNPNSDLVRCPYGRASVRKLLDSYTKAAVNLYGIISREDLVNIFNKQNTEQTSVEEIYILLLPLVLKKGLYGFYKDYILHYWLLDDFNLADNLLTHHEDKARYIPDKVEFLNYENENYEDNDHWWSVRSFMWDVFGITIDTNDGYWEIRDYMIYGSGISELGPILDKYNLHFSDEKQLEKFIELIMLAKNNTRIWENNGHTPLELHEILSKRDENIIDFPTTKKEKIGRNDPCPCGSGKKYKKCCGKFANSKSAQLSSEECQEFYETFYGLLDFVNKKKNVVNFKIKPEYPNNLNDMILHKVREVLWEEPELIDEYISESKLPQEKIETLELWRKKHKKGMFFMLEYQSEYVVVLSADKQREDILYGIQGISNSIAKVLGRTLPVTLKTVLLPFKGKIIYDGFIATMPIEYKDGARKAFREMYESAKKYGVTTSLE